MSLDLSPNVSVVVVSFHTGDVLFRMLDSVLRQPEVKEIILVNNGNPPNVFQRLLDMEGKERLRMVTGQGNIGFASGVNLGARQATGEYLFILNPDCELPAGAVQVFLENAAAFLRPALFGCRLLDSEGREQSGSRRDVLTPLNALSEVFGLYKYFPNDKRLARFNYHNDPLPARTVPMPCISGAVMFLHRDDFWRVGGMDAGYFLHVDDIDFCVSFARTGGTVYFIPNLAISHIGGSSDVPKIKIEFLKAKSFVRYFYKNFPKASHVELAAVTAAIWTRFVMVAAKALTHSGNFGKKDRG